jgi:hypothetical protein
MLKKIVVAIACIAVGLFLSISYGAVAQTRPATPDSAPASNSRLAPVDNITGHWKVDRKMSEKQPIQPDETPIEAVIEA